MDTKKGFTLVELIIVIAIIVILASAVFVAIDPARRLHEARNARRSGDVATILDAVKKYQAYNDGDHYTAVAGMSVNLFYQIGTAITNCGIACVSDNTQSECADLSGMGTNYLPSVPADPRNGSPQYIGYAIRRDANGVITVRACYAEGEESGGEGAAPLIEIIR